MPGRNVRKIYLPDTFYHVYNRGVNKEAIFLDNEDYRVFLNLFKRLLAVEPQRNSQGRLMPNIHGTIELNAYCLMPNHFHMLVHQKTSTAITKLFQSVSTSYAMYFNKKYKRVGHVFQSCFRAALINREDYLNWIISYIHLNPTNFEKWSYSSLPFYLGNKEADWLSPIDNFQSFENSDKYLYYLSELVKSKKYSIDTRQFLNTDAKTSM